ncbi:alpha/beta hydrolase [Hymenobacter qilianensis]|uniref:Alpha/beta hydrolase n=2 Tax=Hymenobacter qilianensis TaxID=1385715 RepID=A0ACB5PVW0_9BACT|nr:alpha/beta hydrolase [Hymenobacter qilianensis]QNP51273.1 alpha/beta fold hydrolase [Hymenobacter qilianensis]GGF76841.1 alpha/beta hydrolase [Hymenobacter qilianensis]
MHPPNPTAESVKAQYPAVPSGLKLLRLKFRVLSAVSSEWAFREAWKVFTTPRRLPIKAWEAKALAHTTQHWAQAESGRVAYYEWNPGGNRTVLLVHGWEHRASFWGHMADGLAKAGFRVVALDGPAHGLSDGKRATLVSFAGAVQAVADAVGPVHAVVAHSFGAACTAGVPVRFNQAAGEQLPRLILMSVPSSTRNVAARFAELLHLPPSVVQRMGQFIQEQYGRSAESFSLLETGRQLPVQRALLFHDHLDPNVPFAEAEEIAQHWPALEFRPTTGLGHNRIMRDLHVIRQVMEFME